jgi:hypothetical protein
MAREPLGFHALPGSWGAMTEEQRDAVVEGIYASLAAQLERRTPGNPAVGGEPPEDPDEWESGR